MADYLTTVENMLSSATRKVDVIVPFVDGVGAQVLASAFDRSPRRTQWTMYVRKCPVELLKEARSRRWTVYEFVGSTPTEHARGFHCKVFIVDDERAVLGSANLIYANLAENVEIGAYLEDASEVAPLLAVPRALARASRVVRY